MQSFNGLGMNLNNLWRISTAQTRSISPENPTGKKAKAAQPLMAPLSLVRVIWGVVGK
jgi:hypothetical protein